VDLVLSPDGQVVGMVHSNNCTSDWNAWLQVIGEAAAALGMEVSDAQLHESLTPIALQGAADAGGLLSYGYVSGEHLTGFEVGCPLFVRKPDSEFTLANFIRAHLFSSLCALRIGLDILVKRDLVHLEELCGHGGFFRAGDVGSRIMAAATNTPVRVRELADYGGASGMALLAAFSLNERSAITLQDFLDEIFGADTGLLVEPSLEDSDGFNRFFKQYVNGLEIEVAAVASLAP